MQDREDLRRVPTSGGVMHSTTLMYKGHRVSIHFNGDYTGMVKMEIPIELAQVYEFHAPGVADVMTSFISVDIPFEVLQSLVVNKIRQDRIAALEEMSDQEILSG